MPTFKVIHYRGKCIGCFACVEADPERWAISRRDGKSTLIGGKLKRDHYIAEVGDHEWSTNEIAAKNCPVGIIHLRR
jgi:ferredoxin